VSCDLGISLFQLFALKLQLYRAQCVTYRNSGTVQNSILDAVAVYIWFELAAISNGTKLPLCLWDRGARECEPFRVRKRGFEFGLEIAVLCSVRFVDKN